jgi:hypothetical protein
MVKSNSASGGVSGIEIGDVEAAAWRLVAELKRNSGIGKLAMARFLRVVVAWGDSVSGGGGGGGGVRAVAVAAPAVPKRRAGYVAPVHYRGGEACGQGVVQTGVVGDVTCGNCKRKLRAVGKLAKPAKPAGVETSQEFDQVAAAVAARLASGNGNGTREAPRAPVRARAGEGGGRALGQTRPWGGTGWTPDWVDLPGVRVCRKCGQGKSLEKEFAGDAKDRKGRKTVCKACDNARRRQWAASRAVDAA